LNRLSRERELPSELAQLVTIGHQNRKIFDCLALQSRTRSGFFFPQLKDWSADSPSLLRPRTESLTEESCRTVGATEKADFSECADATPLCVGATLSLGIG
jgi:hypothetical protein